MFYNGLNSQTRTSVDATVGGTIFAKTPDEYYDMLDKMTINSYQWPSNRSVKRKKDKVYILDPITSLTAHSSVLTTQLAAMYKGGQSNVVGVVAAIEKSHTREEAQYINNRGFGRPFLATSRR